jgi:ureidoglycolate dehydrogenase (NAD+)
MSATSIRISAAELRDFATAILHAAGVERALADEWAKVLVWANLRGHDSHGVLRIPRYLDLLRRNAINATPDMRIERRAGAIVVLEADLAPGAVAMSRAMKEAIACARSVHVGWCAARNITHAGAIGYFARQAAEAGMAGIVMTASGPMMAYHGARVSGVSTNPLAIAVPGKTRSFLLDMSTSNVAMGKILDARDKGAAVPAGWGLDAAGRDTTDPHEITTLLPLGGPKGSGLSLMIECLASLAIENPLIAPALADRNSTDSPVLNGVAIAVDLAALGNADAFMNEVEQLGAAIQKLPRADGVDRILLPGERGDRIHQERKAAGVLIPKGTWSRLLAAAATVGVKAPGRVSE